MFPPVGLVLDTSVWINLLATQLPWEIIAALGCPCFAPEEVVRELRRDPITQQPYPPDSHPLRARHDVEVVGLAGDALSLFLSLVSGASSQSLGDGEAATIALASIRGCGIALDDGKARRTARERFPSIPIFMSVDLLRSEGVVLRLGKDRSRAAFERAVTYGRMHLL